MRIEYNLAKIDASRYVKNEGPDQMSSHENKTITVIL